MRLNNILFAVIILTFSFVFFADISFSQSLNGSYTVGGNSPDYTTLQAAANALKANGISGPVTFNIRPGTYMKDDGATSVMILDSIVAGNTAANRITFQPDAAAGGNVSNVILQSDFNINTNYSEAQIIKVETDYTTIRNLTFKDADSLDTPARFCLKFEGVPNWNTTVDGAIVDGCKFIGTPYYSQGQQYGSDFGIYSEYLTTGKISNNKFSNLMRAVGLDVETGGAQSDSIVVDDNKFDHLYLGFTGAGDPLGSAIEIEYPKAYVKRNFVSNSTGARAIIVVYPAIAEIEANYVNGDYRSEMGLGLNSASQDQAESVSVFNNILIGPGVYGTLAIQTRNTKIYHNTVINSGGNNGLWITGHNCSVINNILKASPETIVAYNINGALGIVSDHNIFYKSPGWYFAQDVTGNLFFTFDDYKLATGLDTNSTFTDVSFEFDSLGIHLDECQAQNSVLDGIHLAEVPSDFYGAYRDSVKPFIGAVEGVRIPFDMYGDPFRTSLTGFPLSVASGNFDNSSLPGIAVPDWDNRKVLLFHNNGATRTFTNNGVVFTGFKPTIVKFYDFDRDNKLDLLVVGDTSTASLEVFWGDGTGGFSGPDIVANSGRIKSLSPGPTFADFTTVITTEDGIQPSTSFIGFTVCTSSRELCHELTHEPDPPDTIYAALNDFVLADVGGTSNLQSIVAPGIFGSTNAVPELNIFDLFSPSDIASNCQIAQTDFTFEEHDYDFPVTGYYTNSSSIIAGDFNDDGHTDFITTGWDDNYCVFVKGGGNLTFTADTIPSSATRGLVKLDYENDGDLDFVTVNNTLDSAGITIFLNDGSGNFTEKKNCFFPFASGHPNGIVAADFDGDGKTDVATVSRTEGGGDSLFVLYNLGGFNVPTGIKPGLNSNIIPEKFELSQNYPNPFNPTTKINFSLPDESNVKIFIYNILGERVKELINGRVSAGEHIINFNAGNFASGIYIYQMIAETISGNTFYATAKKMILLK